VQHVEFICSAKITSCQTEIVDGIQNICFSHTIITHKSIDAWVELQLQVFKVTKIGDMNFIQLQ